MSKLDQSVLDVSRGSHRMSPTWMEPALTNEQYDEAIRVPASAGQWTEREPNTFARHTVRIPVTVGSMLR